MSDMLPKLFESNLPEDQVLFDYESIPAERREFVLQKTAETQWLLKRTADDIVKIGKNLLEIKTTLPYGMFIPWLKSEFEMSERSAYDFINIAKRFGDRFAPGANLGMKILRELAMPSTSDDIIEQVQSGHIPPTLEAIREAKLEARLAKEAEAKARAEAQAAQQQLFNNQEASQAEIDGLTKQIDALKQEMEVLATPEIIIETVTKEVVPQSVANTLEQLQKQVEKLRTDLEEEKKTIPSEALKKLESLQKQAEKLKQQEEVTRHQQERIDKLTSELQAAIRKGVASENDERIRQEWRHITSEARSCLMRLLAQWPSPIDVQSFEADDWARVDQLKQTLRRVMDECDSLRFSGDEMVVDEHMSRSPVRVIDAG